MGRLILFLTLLCPLLSLTGCARYEYDLVQPESLREHIGTQEVQVKLDPLVYQLVTYDNRLVMSIENPTGEAVQLVGDDCVVVDPRGQSHPVRNQMIGAGASIRVFFPPFPDRPQGPTFIIGVGGGISRAEVEQRAIYLTDGGDPYVFAWDGEEDVKMTLVYFYRQTRVDHVLVFHRRRI